MIRGLRAVAAASAIICLAVTSGGAGGTARAAVIPISTATNTALAPITVGRFPGAIAITPDGTTAYVVNRYGDHVTPIRAATNTALKPIQVPVGPALLAITPDGRTAYVISRGTAGTVTPIETATGVALRPITVGGRAIAITP